MSCSWRLIIGWFVNQHIWVEMFQRQRWCTVMQCLQVSGVDMCGLHSIDMVICLWWRLCDLCCDLQCWWERERARRWKQRLIDDQMNVRWNFALKMKTKSDRWFGCAALCLKWSTINSFKFILPTFWSTLAYGLDCLLIFIYLLYLNILCKNLLDLY